MKTRTGSFDHIRKVTSETGQTVESAQSVEDLSGTSVWLFFFNLSLFVSGVRDSVSHTARPDGVSQTDDPPVLMDLPENKSTVP